MTTMQQPERHNSDTLVASLEAFLYLYGEAATKKKAAAVLGAAEREIEAAIAQLREKLDRDHQGGLCLIVSKDGKVQLATKPQFGELLAQLVKEEMSEDLTPASLEVLSLVAYLGPVARSTIEYVRGVNSSFTLRNLLMRGLVEKVAAGKRGVKYQLTPAALRHLGVQKEEELNRYAEFRAAFEKFLRQPDAATP